ncbi:hypothetical protein SBV1_1320001 [Verrucomicrobia bacterium]|nr:hypothetical protein SBV1_1320001 [Verrucomicrobiota bacterium]
MRRAFSAWVVSRRNQASSLGWYETGRWPWEQRGRDQKDAKDQTPFRVEDGFGDPTQGRIGAPFPSRSNPGLGWRTESLQDSKKLDCHP